MDGAALLFTLRVISALLLLLFLAAIALFLQRDLAAASVALRGQTQLQGFIEVISAGGRVQHKLRSVISIGRIASNTIILDNSVTSAQHALITQRDGQWWLEDLHSRNGTLLNGIPVSEPTVISVGDAIEIGEVRLGLLL